MLKPEPSKAVSVQATLLFFAGILAVLIMPVAAVGVFYFAPFTSPWIEIGYYGQFHRVQRIIREFPELTIYDRFQHQDITMEDFGFRVVHRDGSKFSIDFWENSPQMKLTRDAEIRAYIERMVAEGRRVGRKRP